MTWLVELVGAEFWRDWWVWGVMAALFGILELALPGYIFLGFAMSAAILALMLLIGAPITDLLPTAFPGLLLAFALLSVLSWVLLRKCLGIRPGQVKTFRHDINEDR